MPTRIGLIGCGRWGLNILKDLLEMGMDVVVAESAPTVAHKVTRSFGVPVVADPLDIDGPDGFIIATPASTHTEVIRKVLPLRLPIFVEKPLTADPKEARALTKEGDGLIFVMHIWHYHAGVEMLSSIRESGELGPVKMLRTERKNWTSPRTDVDSTWTLIPHDLSIAKRILGKLPEPRMAVAEMNKDRAVGMLAVLGDGAPTVIVDASNRFRDKRREIRMHCELGVAVLPADDSGFIEITRETAGIEDATSDTEKRQFEFSPPLKRELELFADHINGGPPPPTDLQDGIEVVEAVAKLRQLAGLQDGL